MPDRDGINFQFLTEESTDMICLVGLDLVMNYVSTACRRLLGWTPEEMCGKGLCEFVSPEESAALLAAYKRFTMSRGNQTTTMLRMRKKSGYYRWMEMNARVARDKQKDKIKCIVLTMRDATERKLREDSLEAMAFEDSLTGLGNRRLFDQILDREWEHAMRHGSEISLILLDIDCFKQYNDLYGHPMGDDCLRAVAKAVKSGVRRAVDFVARYGGEELAIILPGTDSEGAYAVAENLRAKVEALQLPHTGSPTGQWLTASFGVTTASTLRVSAMASSRSLLKAADLALYRAKDRGRNCIAASSMDVDQDQLV